MTTRKWTTSRRRLWCLGVVGRKEQLSSRRAATQLSPQLQLHSSSSSSNASSRRLLLRRRQPPGTYHPGGCASGPSSRAGDVEVGRRNLHPVCHGAGHAGATPVVSSRASTSARYRAHAGTRPHGAEGAKLLGGLVRIHPISGTETGSRVQRGPRVHVACRRFGQHARAHVLACDMHRHETTSRMRR